MQGRWVVADEPMAELIIDGGEIICFGKRVAYDYIKVARKDGALTVSLEIDDPAAEDTFQRTNITELVRTARSAAASRSPEAILDAVLNLGIKLRQASDGGVSIPKFPKYRHGRSLCRPPMITLRAVAVPEHGDAGRLA